MSGPAGSRGVRALAAPVLAVVCLAAALSLPPAALGAAPALRLDAALEPGPGVPLGGRGKLTFTVADAGDADLTADPLTVVLTLPAGLRAASVSDERKQSGASPAWSCSIAPDSRSVGCTFSEELAHLHESTAPIGPGEEPCVGISGATCRIFVTVAPDPGTVAGDLFTASAEACGAGAQDCAITVAPIPIVPHFEITSFDGGVFAADGSTVTQAGAHPDHASTTFFLTQTAAADGAFYSTEDFRDEVVDFPPGLIVNPSRVPACTEVELSGSGCPPESQVGVVTLFGNGSFVNVQNLRLFNMKPPAGAAALFGFKAFGAVLHLFGRLHRDDGVPGGYRLRVEALNAPQTLPVAGSTVTLWGVPAGEPFLTLPTSCEGPLRTEIAVSGWQGASAGAGFLSHEGGEPASPVGVEGCEAVDFSPTLRARPTTALAGSPTGLDADLHIPQDEDPAGTAEAHLRKAVVTLPEGLAIDPSVANGLVGCSAAEADLHGPGPARCPDASKLGTVEIDTPLLAQPLSGGVYLAEPFENPFGSLLALYAAVDDPRTGVDLELAAELKADPVSGRLTATFSELPQLPFENIRFHLFQGSLTTPPTCGAYSTRSALTPWSAPASGPPATPSGAFAIAGGPGGGTCPRPGAGDPPAPAFGAGASIARAGASSPLTFSLRRGAGAAELGSVALTAPPGIGADLRGIPLCPEAALAAISSAIGSARGEAEHPSCPGASRVGELTVGAGAGPAPYFLSGDVYLAGPYRGSPRSLAAVLPVLAGPFDLGTVVDRIAVDLDPRTAQLRLASDPLPRILAGVPIDLRELRVRLDRPGLLRNPTSCERMSILATVTSPQGARSDLSDRFQVGGCRRLGFAPRLGLGFSGAAGRNGHPGVAISIAPRASDANIAEASLTLPAGELLDTRHIRALCARAIPPGRCPRASRIGTARIRSPLDDHAFRGPIYARRPAHGLPGLVADLHGGGVRVLIHGSAGSAAGGRLRIRLAGLPDIPLSQASIALTGGRHGIVVNSASLCGRTPRASTLLYGHNGHRSALRPRIRLEGRC